MTDAIVADECAKMLQALAEPSRIRLIDCLRTGEKNVTELATMINVEIVNVSHHLGVLRDVRLVNTVRDGRFIIYSLNPDFFTVDAAHSIHLRLGWCKIEIPHN